MLPVLLLHLLLLDLHHLHLLAQLLIHSISNLLVCVTSACVSLELQTVLDVQVPEQNLCKTLHFYIFAKD